MGPGGYGLQPGRRRSQKICKNESGTRKSGPVQSESRLGGGRQGVSPYRHPKLPKRRHLRVDRRRLLNTEAMKFRALLYVGIAAPVLALHGATSSWPAF